MKLDFRDVLRVAGLALLVCMALVPAVSQTRGVPIVVPSYVKKSVFAADFTIGPSKATLPIVSNGFLLSFSRQLDRNVDPVKGIFLTALGNSSRRRMPFWLNGASAIHLDTGTVTSNGHVLIGGSYLQSSDPNDIQKFDDDPSTPEPQVTNFVADLDAAGNLVAVHGLQEFTPERVCSTKDGSFWVLGQDWPLERQRRYFLLRRYNTAGLFVQGYLTQVGKLDSPNYRVIQGRSRDAAFLTCGDDSVGVYLQRTGGYLWCEVDLSTGKVAVHKVTILPRSVPTGVALFASGVVYASFRQMTKQGVAVQFGPPLGMYKLNMGSPQASWQAVAPTSDGKAYSTILGRDGAYLVHLKGPKGPAADPTLYWTQATQ